jgi:hypothetical protein
MKLTHLAAVLLVASPMVVSAAGYVEGYYVNSDLDVSLAGAGSGDDDGAGFGIRASHALHTNYFLVGEAESISYDDSDTDVRFLRLGAGANSDPKASVVGFIYGEVVNASIDTGEDDSSETGYGAHFGAKFKPMTNVSLVARLGYVEVDEAGGMEGLISGTYSFTPNFGATVAYRALNQSQEGGDLDLSDWRVGVRYTY